MQAGIQPQEHLETLLRSYESYFDIQRDVACGGLSFAAFAVFHSRSERYVLSKKAQLWAAENHEYTYFALCDVLTEDLVRSYGFAALEDGRAHIKPNAEHMYSYVSLIFIANTITDAAAKLLQRTDYRKDFLFSIHGWMEFRMVAYECATGRKLHNRRGKALVSLNDNKK